MKYQCGDKFVDASASRFEVNEKMRNHYLSNGVLPALETDVKVGNCYARRSADDLFERVRVEEVLNYNHQVYLNFCLLTKIFSSINLIAMIIFRKFLWKLKSSA